MEDPMKKAGTAKPSGKFVAFLRGINVGGRTVKMAELKRAFESLGFRNVRTILASGNVVFDAARGDRASLTREIEETLKKRWGFDIPTALRSAEDLSALAAADPFKGIAVGPQTRFYITFLGEKRDSSLKLPYESPEKDVRIFSASPGELASVLTLSPFRRGHTVPPSLASAGPLRRGHTVPNSASIEGPSRRGHTVPPSLASAGPFRRGHTVPNSASNEGPGRGTPELMALLEKAFGKDITTRNWKTLKKLPL
jgi:uncharacterized protein (DUF1697 family)